MELNRRSFIGGVLGFITTLAIPRAGAPIEPRTWKWLEFSAVQHPSINEWVARWCGQRNDDMFFYAQVGVPDKESATEWAKPLIRQTLNGFLESDCYCRVGFTCQKHLSINPLLQSTEEDEEENAYFLE